MLIVAKGCRRLMNIIIAYDAVLDRNFVRRGRQGKAKETTRKKKNRKMSSSSSSSEVLERYETLRLRESLVSRFYDYPIVCNELSFILRGAYAQLPKNLQSILFQDTLSAFRLLPQVQTQRGMRAANLLLQSAEVALPKQKRVLAVTEFKHAVVAYKRRHKTQHVEGSAPLPNDVLVHLFGFLDMHSLVATGLVCRSWNAAANDNMLWESHYHIFFGNMNSCTERTGQIREPAEKGTSVSYKYEESTDAVINLNWKSSFKRTYLGSPSTRFTSNKGYCRHCKSIVWLSTMKCSNVCNGPKLELHQIKPISSQQVVNYLLEDSLEGSSESDSDSDEGSTLKLWAYSRNW